MKNLTLFLLGLVFIPACLSQNNDKQCFSQKLKPSYPCCKGDNVVYVDKDGYWGVENNKWCGIGNGPFDESGESCFSVVLGYKCCKSCDVKYYDKDGDWGVENGKWCGIKESCYPTIEIIEEPVKNTTDISGTDFEFTFLKLENNKKNMLYSPFSIKYGLNMLQEGAAENTYAEMNKVIGNAELTKYTSIDENLSLANGLYIRDTYYEHVKTNYINTLKEKYEAEIVEDEFKDAQNVNKWIEDKTLGIIKNMLEDEVVQNRGSVMILINALAIDMEWVSQFSCEKTYGGTFYLDNGEEMTATMMFNKEVFSESVAYYKNDDITVLTMDLKEYNGIQFEFMAIMPNENLSNYVENVSLEQINEIDKNLKLSSNELDGVNVKIPKFKFNYDLNLKNDLIDLGIKDAFDELTADFSKMSDAKELDESLYVSDARHKADIEFTEKGAKAAAVTVFIMTRATSMMPRETHPVDVEINKPFMFIIRDKNTKDIWFTGTVYEPNSWEKDKASYSPTSRY